MVTRIREQWNSAGQAIVEFALAATLIFFLLAAAVDLGMIFFTLQGLNNAAQEGARYGARWLYTDPVTGERSLQTVEVRNRVRFESGTRGGINFVNLHDLNNNDILDVPIDGDPNLPGREGLTDPVNIEDGDSEKIVEEYIEVTLLGDRDDNGEIAPEGEAGANGVEFPDPQCLSGESQRRAVEPYPCFVRVEVSYRYDIVFGLAPALSDQIVLRQAHTERIIDPFRQRWADDSSDVYQESSTPTPSNTPLPTSTHTNTPTATVTGTRTDTPTATETPTGTLTDTPTNTLTPSITNTATPTITGTRTQTPSPTYTPTPGDSPTPSNTPTPRPEIFVGWITPNQDATETYVVNDRDDTRFQVIAYDELAAGYNPALAWDDLDNDGIGINHVEFQLVRPNGTVYRPPVQLQAGYCLFGGDAPCDRWSPWSDGDDIFTVPGTYTLRAKATALGSTEMSEWAEVQFEILPFDARIIPAVYDQDQSELIEMDSDGIELDTRDQSKWRAIAYDPLEVTNPPDASAALSDHMSHDGTGISKMQYVLYSPTGAVKDSNTFTSTDYCIFGGSDNCYQMAEDDFEDVIPGTYMLWMRAKNDFAWSDWISVPVEVPEIEVFIAFTNPMTDNTVFYSRQDTDFRAIAYDPAALTVPNPPLASDPIADHIPFDGEGITEVEFKITTPAAFGFPINKDGSTNNMDLTNLQDEAPMYCPFGPWSSGTNTNGSCDPMDSEEYDLFKMLPGGYILEARAKPDGMDRWSAWEQMIAYSPELPPCNQASYIDPSGPWSAYTSAEIGSSSVTPGLGMTGLQGIDPDQMYICGSGDNMWENSDPGFQYVYRTMPSTFTQMTARLMFADASPDKWAKLGLMIRSSTNADASNAGIFLTRDYNVTSQWRPQDGNSTSSHRDGVSAESPVWLRITRSNAGGGWYTISLLYSFDGASWTTLRTENVYGLDNDSLIGFGVASHNDGSFARAIFDSVTIE